MSISAENSQQKQYKCFIPIVFNNNFSMPNDFKIQSSVVVNLSSNDASRTLRKFLWFNVFTAKPEKQRKKIKK